MHKGGLSIKGARFEGRTPEEMMLSGRGTSNENKLHRTVLLEERNGSDAFVIRSSSPSPSVASLISNAQNELNKHHQYQEQQHQTLLQNQNNPASLNSVSGLGQGKGNGNMLNHVNHLNNSSSLGKAAGTAAVAEEMSRQKQLLAASNGLSGNDDVSVLSGSTNSSPQQPNRSVNTQNALKSQQGKLAPRYWTAPLDAQNGEDIVVIHVCDENRQISRDFCCKRDILVEHMKYFEKFLKENEAGYDDIDISVHCDVEIFEWLMSYIHEPDKPPNLEKSIVVSILISSDFLQMEALVEHCLVHISNNLNETIRLPIDLSCISDKIVNRLAALTHLKTLAHTKDRKDKLLNKLYKRRVELDFSRKSGARGGVRTIAASLTCCRYCGIVYLDNWVSYLHCNQSPLAIDYRGKLTKRHSAIPAWSLTTYLKSLHTSGMNWDCIYWHVWASCQVFRVSDFMVSMLEVDRFTIEADGLVFDAPNVLPVKDASPADVNNVEKSVPSPKDKDATPTSAFTLGTGELFSGVRTKFKLKVTPYESRPHPQITYTLNPNRPPEVLPIQNFELICTQIKYITSATNKTLIQKQASAMLQASGVNVTEFKPFNFQQALFCDLEAGLAEFEERARGRSRSPNEKRKGKVAGGGMLASKSQTRIAADKKNISSKNIGKDKGGKDVGDSADRGSSVERDSGGDSGSDSGNEANKKSGFDAETRRSRSMGPTAQSSKGGKTEPRKGTQNMSSGTVRRVVSNPGDEGFRVMSADNPSIARQMTMFKTVPPEVIRRLHVSKGSVRGVWLQPHPLQLHPAQYADLVNSAKEKTELSESKRFEWQMDLVREYDERRALKLETFLVQNRNFIESNARSADVLHAMSMLKASGQGPVTTKMPNGKDVYYRDRAHQPI